jgi:hypothetical protein
LLQVGEPFENGRQGFPDALHPFGQLLHPLRGRDQDRRDGRVGDVISTSTHSKAARNDGTRRRSSHSSKGTSAIAMTKAAVVGRKNSAP